MPTIYKPSWVRHEGMCHQSCSSKARKLALSKADLRANRIFVFSRQLTRDAAFLIALYVGTSIYSIDVHPDGTKFATGGSGTS